MLMSDEQIDKALRTIVKGAGIVFIGFVAEYLISFIGKVIIARWLEVSSFGCIAIGTMILSFATIISQLGLNSGIIRYLPQVRGMEEKRDIVLFAFQVSIGLSLIICAIIYYFAEIISVTIFHNSNLTEIIRIFALIIPLSVFVNMTVSVFIGLKNAKPRTILQNITIPTGRLIFVLIMLTLGFGAVGVAYGYLLAYFAAFLLSLLYITRDTPFIKDIKGFSYIRKDLLLFSLPLMISTTTVYIMTNTDTFMLGYLMSSFEVGIYNVSYSLATFAHVFSVPLGILFTPVFSEMLLKYDKSCEKIYRIVTKWMIVLSLPVFLVLFLFSKQVICITFGSKYSEGAIALQILVLCFFVNPFFGPTLQALISIGESKKIMYFNLTSAILNVFLNYTLIPILGIVGAALATGMSYVILNLLYLYTLYKLTNLNPFYAASIKPLLFSVMCGVGLYILINYMCVGNMYKIIIFSLLLIITLFLSLICFGGFEKEDLSLINSIEHKTGIKLGFIKKIIERYCSNY